ncbi:UvrD-helicase domain-containing protein [Hydromonas duriensis]|uniref:Superfamily I DNA/RNA helicase n=1 Tax=Hydromonas duriensis TaxID=1527608 RepID=A0A4R6Y9N6_9BURK|nr:ATP-dependent helicase [Hydromonas duriensis]TDR32162.1 superfamily I DNA/RNA helicase [Hydromonas duriensis]
MSDLSAEQEAIVKAPLESLSVIACAGSGKTRTAVHRLVEMRRLMGDHRGRVALLSFSNIAVDTFRESYRILVQSQPACINQNRIEIGTLDGFITSNILSPHAHRTMGATQPAFLVAGGETFLKGFTFRTNTHPLDISKMKVGFRDGNVYFYYTTYNNQAIELDTTYALNLVNRLGEIGAYTHNLGRYWCYRVLSEQPNLLRALALRYPQILIDESQDIGVLHQAILEQLISAGSQITLIGDPNQGIYEFADADGKFLMQYGLRADVRSYQLTRNYRSISSIVTLANNLSGRTDTAEMKSHLPLHGAFFISYKDSMKEQLITAFQETVIAANLNLKSSAVVCRNSDLVNTLTGENTPVGFGLVKGFVKAAILRDKHQDYLNAFKIVASCISKLLIDPPKNITVVITHPEFRSLRHEIWSFIRNPDLGLPSTSLIADTEWHPLLLERVKVLLSSLQLKFGLKIVDRLGNKLTVRELPNSPLVIEAEIEKNIILRVDTVHQVKGESLDSVLYLATSKNITDLLNGLDTENGRIGYVAVTRARYLFWLGVPEKSLNNLRSTLISKGFQEAVCA